MFPRRIGQKPLGGTNLIVGRTGSSLNSWWSIADINGLVALASSVEFDPNVWSGRALQEDFFELADLRSCINVSGL
jgi:hypothetical protein